MFCLSIKSINIPIYNIFFLFCYLAIYFLDVLDLEPTPCYPDQIILYCLSLSYPSPPLTNFENKLCLKVMGLFLLLPLPPLSYLWDSFSSMDNCIRIYYLFNPFFGYLVMYLQIKPFWRYQKLRATKSILKMLWTNIVNSWNSLSLSNLKS